MSPEHDPTTQSSDKSDLDPSIDPKVLIEQDGPNIGAIAASETSEGKTLHEKGTGGSMLHFPKLSHEVIEGLPVIGAEAEDEMRERLSEANSPNGLPSGRLNGVYSEAVRDMGGDEKAAVEALADKAGTEAMVEEIKKRATDLIKKQYPLASDELVVKFADTAAEKFKANLEAKEAEARAKQEQAVQDMIDKIQAGTPLSEIDPSLDAEQMKSDDESEESPRYEPKPDEETILPGDGSAPTYP